MKQSARQTTRAYRIYLIDRAGQIARAHKVAAVSDEEACELAKLMLDAQLDYTSIEVWDRARHVYRMP